jgi:hypothetical protein
MTGTTSNTQERFYNKDLTNPKYKGTQQDLTDKRKDSKDMYA